MMRFIKKYWIFLILLILLGIAPEKIIHKNLVVVQTFPLELGATAVKVTELSAVKEQPRTRILFTGDINLGRCIAERTLRSYSYTNNYNYPFQLVADKLRTADITVGSLDSPLSDISAPMPCPESMNLIGPTRMAEGLQFAGFDVLTVATNHIKDCGRKGYGCDTRSMLDTIDALAAVNVRATGAGKTLSESRAPVVIEHNGIRFAFLGINQIEQRVWAAENTPGVAPLAPEYIGQIKADIAAAKQIADVVIVMPHWGVEYAAQPDDIQRVWARDFIGAGASLVIGNHPHIVQPMEVFSDKLIFYALGNFVFDQEQSFRRESVVVEVNFIGAEIESWKLHAASTNYYNFQTYWAENAEADYILARANQ